MYGRVVQWIESKASFGDPISYESHANEQYWKYYNRFVTAPRPRRWPTTPLAYHAVPGLRVLQTQVRARPGHLLVRLCGRAGQAGRAFPAPRPLPHRHPTAAPHRACRPPSDSHLSLKLQIVVQNDPVLVKSLHHAPRRRSAQRRPPKKHASKTKKPSHTVSLAPLRSLLLSSFSAPVSLARFNVQSGAT